MTNPTNETAPNPRRDYGQEWLHHPTDPADVAWDGPEKPRMIASPTQIEAGRAEMNHEMLVREWSEKVSQYPRTVDGKFFESPYNRTFTRVSFGPGESDGRFGEVPPIEGSNEHRLLDIVGKSDQGIRGIAQSGANFITKGPTWNDGTQELDSIVFMQFLEAGEKYTPAGSRGNVPLTTTFYLPAAEANQLIADVRRDPDVMADTFERTVGAGIPGHERVNRVRATHLALVSENDLAAAGRERFAQQRFNRLLADEKKWLTYATPHGGEARQADRMMS